MFSANRPPAMAAVTAPQPVWPITTHKGECRDSTAYSKIGRGSCRGRGEISGVAGSLKKKKKGYAGYEECNPTRSRNLAIWTRCACHIGLPTPVWRSLVAAASSQKPGTVVHIDLVETNSH